MHQPACQHFRPRLCTNRHDPHYEVLTGRLLEHTIQPPQVRVQHPKATDESYMVSTYPNNNPNPNPDPDPNPSPNPNPNPNPHHPSPIQAAATVMKELNITIVSE